MSHHKMKKYKEIPLRHIQIEIGLCYAFQNDLTCVVEFFNKRKDIEEKVINLALAVFLQQRVERMREGHYLTFEQLIRSLENETGKSNIS